MNEISKIRKITQSEVRSLGVTDDGNLVFKIDAVTGSQQTKATKLLREHGYRFGGVRPSHLKTRIRAWSKAS